MAPNPKSFVLKLANYCKCDGCDETLRKLHRIDGVHSTLIDAKTGELTVSGPVDPQKVITFLKERGKKSTLIKKEIQPKRKNPGNSQIVTRSAGPKSVDKPMERDIHPCDPKHDHELELKNYNKPFTCNKCREFGFTSGYRCKHCIYDLHKVCLNLKPKITPDLFPGSTFKIREKPGKICDACGMKIHGHSYSCKENNLNLHPACSELRGKLRISGTDFVLCKKVKDKCFGCKKKKPSWLAETKVAGLCYVSERNKFSCHVHCLSLVMQEAWKRGGGDLDRNGAVAKVDLKLVSAKGGGGLFRGAVTIFLKTIISILFGDPTGLIVSALMELVKEYILLTL